MASGRPIIIVEHHQTFRNGYDQITALVDWINSLGKIRWVSLKKIAGYYLGYTESAVEKFDRPPSFSYFFDAKVGLRRLFSEFRDNYVETNPLLSKAYKTLRH
jgi:hypothetical protein